MHLLEGARLVPQRMIQIKLCGLLNLLILVLHNGSATAAIALRQSILNN